MDHHTKGDLTMRPHETNTWFRLSLGDANMADDEMQEIGARFDATWGDHGSSSQAAVFRRLESTTGLHCHAVLYFTPRAAAFARQASAQPCRCPQRNGMELLAGSPACWRLLEE